MISLIKKHWFYVLVFLILSFVFYNVLGLLSQPIEQSDFVSPIVLVFSVLFATFAFFPAMATVFLLGKKTQDFSEQLKVVLFSAVLFSLVFSLAGFFVLFSFDQEQWEQGFLDSILTMPFEFSFEEFQAMTFFDAIKQSFALSLETSGAAVFGFLFARKILQKSG